MDEQEDIQAAINALRDTTFNFFEWQPFTSTIIQPFNDFLNGPLQSIIENPVSYETSQSLGLASFSNVVFMPPFKGAIVGLDLNDKLEKLRSERDDELSNLKLEFPSTAEMQTDRYARRREAIMREYTLEEHAIVKKTYISYPRSSWFLPSDARDTDGHYMLTVYADVTLREVEKQKPGTTVLADDEIEAELGAYVNPSLRQFYMDKFAKQSTQQSKTYHMVKLFAIPLMVGSEWCWLTLSGATPQEWSHFGECDVSPKGYFIVGGNPRVFVTQIKLTPNEPRCAISKITPEIHRPILELKCETRSRKANQLSLIFGGPSGKTKIEDAKILFMTLPFMRSNLKSQGKKKVKSTKNVSFNVLWIFRFYVIWSAREIGLNLDRMGGSTRVALGEFNRYLLDICHEDETSPDKPTIYYKVVSELVDTIKHMELSDESPKEDHEFILHLRQMYGMTAKERPDPAYDTEENREEFSIGLAKFKAQLDNQFLPQIQCPDYVVTQENDIWSPFMKFTFLTQMIVKYVKTFVGAKGIDDRDSFTTIQLATAPIEIGVLIRKALGLVRGSFAKDLAIAGKDQFANFMKQEHPTAIKNVESHGNVQITTALLSCFMTGRWGLSIRGGGQKRPGVVQLMDTKSLLSQINYVRKTAIPMKRNSSIDKPRQVHQSSYGIMDPSNTPDSDQVGLVRSLALSVMISSDSVAAYDYVMNMVEEGLALERNAYESEVHATFKNGGIPRYPLYVNNVLVGYCTKNFYNELREAKMTKKLGWYSEVYMKKDVDKWQTTFEVHVKTNGGRAMRPLFVIKDNELLVLKYIMGEQGEFYRANFAELLDLGCVEYVSASEFRFAEVAMTYEGFLRSRGTRRFDYMEMDPMMSMSVETATQPFPQHNPNPRAIYYGAMARQPVSVPFVNFAHLQETETKVLNYPHAPLVTTDMAKIAKTKFQPAGQMVYVAIKSEPSTDEDPTRWRKGFIDAGGLNGTIYVTHEAKATLTIPDPSDNPATHDKGLIRVRYNREEGDENVEPEHEQEFVDESVRQTELMETDEQKDWPFPEGFPRLRGASNILVRPGDILARFKSKQSESADVEKLKLTGKRSGFVPHINTFTREGRVVKITTRHPHIPREGDKAANEFAQKGVMGEIIPDADMPFSVELGIAPDVIFSPTSLPSRMTIGMPLAILAGASFAAPDRNRVVKNLIRWTRVQEVPEVDTKNDFWILLSKGYVNASHGESKFTLKSELRSQIEEEVRLKRRLAQEEPEKHKIEYPVGVKDDKAYVDSLLNIKIFDMLTDEGWSEVRGLVIVDNIAERKFIVPSEDYVSRLQTGERAILFSQLPTDLQRSWYDRNEDMLIPNYMMRVPRAPNDESVTDASAFRAPDKERMMALLKSKGFTSHGESKFVNKDGQMTKMTIFSGPLFWMQLAHLAESKYQVRDQGSMSVASRGAAKGKSVGGAVRSGELSHAAMIAHGDAEYLKERFMTAADKYNVLICSDCGNTCYIQSVTAVATCDTCGSKALPRSMTLPYSGLRLMSMLAAVGAQPVFRTRVAQPEQAELEYREPEDIGVQRKRIKE